MSKEYARPFREDLDFEVFGKRMRESSDLFMAQICSVSKSWTKELGLKTEPYFAKNN